MRNLEQVPCLTDVLAGATTLQNPRPYTRVREWQVLTLLMLAEARTFDASSKCVVTTSSPDACAHAQRQHQCLVCDPRLGLSSA